VQLRCVKVERTPKPRSSFVNWMVKAEKSRKEQGIALSKHEYGQWRQAKILEFSNLDPKQLQLEQMEARAAHSRKLDELKEKETELREFVGYAENSCAKTVVDVVGDRRTPYVTEAFAKRVRSSCGVLEVLHHRSAFFTRLKATNVT